MWYVILMKMCSLNLMEYNSVHLKYEIFNGRYTAVKLLSKLKELKMNLNLKYSRHRLFTTTNYQSSLLLITQKPRMVLFVRRKNDFFLDFEGKRNTKILNCLMFLYFYFNVSSSFNMLEDNDSCKTFINFVVFEFFCHYLGVYCSVLQNCY